MGSERNTKNPEIILSTLLIMGSEHKTKNA